MGDRRYTERYCSIPDFDYYVFYPSSLLFSNQLVELIATKTTALNE